MKKAYLPEAQPPDDEKQEAMIVPYSLEIRYAYIACYILK